jgi:hypothetical protein
VAPPLGMADEDIPFPCPLQRAASSEESLCRGLTRRFAVEPGPAETLQRQRFCFALNAVLHVALEGRAALPPLLAVFGPRGEGAMDGDNGRHDVRLPPFVFRAGVGGSSIVHLPAAKAPKPINGAPGTTTGQLAGRDTFRRDSGSASSWYLAGRQ